MFVTLSGLYTHDASAALPFEIRYKTGDPAPGGGNFVELRAPQINAAGDVAFAASTAPLWGSGAGIWAPSATDRLTVVAKVGMNVQSNGFSAFALNPQGQLAFAASTGLWAYDPAAGARVLAQENTTAPGTGGALFREFYTSGNGFVADPTVSAAGLVITQAPLKLGTGSPAVTQSSDYGYWSAPAAPGGGGGGGALTNVWREGPAPGASGNWSMHDFVLPLRANQLGHTVALLNGTTADTGGIWRSTTPGTWTPIASYGTTYSSLIDPSLNADGDIAFAASLAGSNDSTLRVRREAGGAGVQEITRRGQPAPGTTGTFLALNSPVVGGDGSVFFYANVTGGGDARSGLWRADVDNAISPIGITGQPAPDLAGYTWHFNSLPALATNDAGDLLFTTSVSDEPDPVFFSHDSLWFYDADTDLVSHVLTGGLPLPGDGRTVSRFNIHAGVTTNHDGQGSMLNDAGQFAVQVQFADNSQAILVYNVVPEPAAPVLLCGIVVSLALRRRRCRRARTEA